MRVTAETSDEELDKIVAWTRTSLIEAVNKGTQAADLAGAVNQIANQEGKARVLRAYRNALQGGASPLTAYQHIISQHLLPGASDTYSGRSNDARRAQFDGVREQINDMQYWPEHRTSE